MSKLVKLKDIFHIEYGNQLDLNKLKIVENKEGINFINRTEKELGFVAKVKEMEVIKPYDKGLMTVSLGGSILKTFVQPEKFYTGQNVKVLNPKRKMNFKEKIYYSMCIEKNKFRYSSFGREANKTLDDLLVPSLEEIPQWVYEVEMPKKPTKEPFHNKTIKLSDREWKSFILKDLFKISTGEYYAIDSFDDGNVLLVSSKDKDNGIKNFTNLKAVYNRGISIGKVGMSTFFQNKPFCITSDVCVLERDNLSDYAYLFIASALKKEQYRWCYGRQIRLEDTEKSTVYLPIDNKGNPDWQFMEDYIKSLPYTKNL